MIEHMDEELEPTLDPDYLTREDIVWSEIHDLHLIDLAQRGDSEAIAELNKRMGRGK